MVLDDRGELDVAVGAALVVVGAELVDLDRERELGGRIGVHAVEVEDHVDHVRGGELPVHFELRCHRADELLVGEGIGQPVLRHGGGQDPQELVVPADAGQVALVLERPVVGVRRGDPGGLVLETASRAWNPSSFTQPGVETWSPEKASNTGSGKYIFTPPRASTTLANVSKLRTT